MKKSVKWASGLIMAGGLLVISALQDGPARADVQSFGAGMLTFTASEEILDPDSGETVGSPYTFTNNSSTPDLRAHYVKVTGPPNTGGIPIDYGLQFDWDVNDIVGNVYILNTQVSLNPAGKWIVDPVYSTAASVLAGGHTAAAFASIKSLASGATASGVHYHEYSR